MSAGISFAIDREPDNFVDRNAPADDAETSESKKPTTPPLMTRAATDDNEQKLTDGPPEAKRPRLEAKTTVSTLHPVSELTQRWQGAMFVLTGNLHCNSQGERESACVCVCVCERES